MTLCSFWTYLEIIVRKRKDDAIKPNHFLEGIISGSMNSHKKTKAEAMVFFFFFPQKFSFEGGKPGDLQYLNMCTVATHEGNWMPGFRFWI